jgi:hypothetical protein
VRFSGAPLPVIEQTRELFPQNISSKNSKEK